MPTRRKSGKDKAVKWLAKREKDKSKKVDTFVQGKRIPFNRLFVPVYDYETNRRRLSYLISDYGEVISFKYSKPIFKKPCLRNEGVQRYCYNLEGNVLLVSRLVWFSFARQWLYDPQSVPRPLAFTEITSVEQLKAFAVSDRKSGDKYEIHHGDEDPTNNKYSNLVLEDRMHAVLSGIEGAKEAARRNGLDEDKALAAMVSAAAKKKDVSTAVHLSGKVTRTKDFNLSDKDLENVMQTLTRQGKGFVVYDRQKAKELLTAEYFKKYPQGSNTTVDTLYTLGGLPYYNKLTYKNNRLYIGKLTYSSNVKLFLGDITEQMQDSIIDVITTAEQLKEHMTRNNLTVTLTTETKGNINAVTLVAGKDENESA